MDRETIITEVCARLAKGEPLAVICRSEGMPSRQAIYDWRDQDDAIARRLKRAREIGFDVIAEQALEIADTPVEGVTTTIGEDGTKRSRATCSATASCRSKRG